MNRSYLDLGYYPNICLEGLKKITKSIHQDSPCPVKCSCEMESYGYHTHVQWIHYMKSSVFWDIMLCSLLKVNRCFRGICQLPFLTFSGLHGIISQKREFFITISVRTSNQEYIRYFLITITCSFAPFVPVTSNFVLNTKAII
jgi:hypothetical protein